MRRRKREKEREKQRAEEKGAHKGDENRLKIARERIAVGTFESGPRILLARESLIVRIAFRRLDVDDDGERPSRYHYEGRPAG